MFTAKQQSLILYNSLTKQKEPFHPLNPPFVGMYVCGPTVYGKAHLGHARCAIAFDLLFRYLRHLSYQVRYVRNITDVGHMEQDVDMGEDKVQKQAQLEAVTPMEVAQRYTNGYRHNMQLLNVLSPSIEPCASGHILEQIDMIEQILKAGFAYVREGSVYFDLIKYGEMGYYGNLSGNLFSEIRSNTRALYGHSHKKHGSDFALWKKAPENHIMRWSSPWSVGFPGWHIECTAMSTKYLGERFDIHGGGLDLLFPHHECEMAQSYAALGHGLASYWMHSNLVTIDGTKMGKSLGNFITLDDLFAGTHPSLDQPYSPMALRFFMLQSHYRKPVSFSLDGLKVAYQGYRKLMNGLHMLKSIDARWHEQPKQEEEELYESRMHEQCRRCYEAMDDDLNTPKVLAHLYGLLKLIHHLDRGNGGISREAFSELQTTYSLFLTDILGFQEECQTIVPVGLELLLTLYKQAKVSQREEQVVLIRCVLRQMGIAVQDGPNGVKWVYCC